MSVFKEYKWKQCYDGVNESITPSAPETCSKGVDIHTTIDSDHAGDELTRQYRMIYFIF